MQWSLVPRRTAALVPVLAVMAAVAACAPRSGVAQTDEIATPVARSAAVAEPLAPGPEAGAPARPAASRALASQPPGGGNAPGRPAAAPSRPAAGGVGLWPQFRGPDRTGVSREMGLL